MAESIFTSIFIVAMMVYVGIDWAIYEVKTWKARNGK